MKRLAFWGSALLVALVLGGGSAWWTIRQGATTFVRNGPWRYNPLVGSSAADPHTRARIAKAGLLALNNSEAVYFIAENDSDGNPLEAGVTYRIEGRDLDARWWSITAYDSEHFLIPNKPERYSCNSASIQRDKDGSYRICVCPAGSRDPKEMPPNWIDNSCGGNFVLTLRIYNPSAHVRDNLGAIELPRITREGKGS